MKLKGDVLLSSFLQQVRLSSGEVWFITPEGDRLNLKSVLSEYLFLSAAISTSLAHRGHVEFQYSSDAVALASFFQEG